MPGWQFLLPEDIHFVEQRFRTIEGTGDCDVLREDLPEWQDVFFAHRATPDAALIALHDLYACSYEEGSFCSRISHQERAVQRFAFRCAAGERPATVTPVASVGKALGDGRVGTRPRAAWSIPVAGQCSHRPCSSVPSPSANHARCGIPPTATRGPDPSSPQSPETNPLLLPFPIRHRLRLRSASVVASAVGGGALSPNAPCVRRRPCASAIDRAGKQLPQSRAFPNVGGCGKRGVTCVAPSLRSAVIPLAHRRSRSSAAWWKNARPTAPASPAPTMGQWGWIVVALVHGIPAERTNISGRFKREHHGW